jgi:phage terminase large subunit-like protein
MATLRPDFRERFGVQVNAKSLTVPGSMAKFEPVIGKPGDGSSPHCSITDEYHEHVTDEQLATMETGMGAREQPLSIVVSTAGDNIAGPCRADWLECQKVLQGTTIDETLFVLIFTIDKDDDWTSESSLRKANPNFGISVSAEFLLAQQRDAINNPRKQGHFKTKHLNIWVQARDAFIDLLKWRACADESLRLDQYRGRRCYLGLDLASKIDLCALELLFPETDGTFTRFGKYYLPRSTVDLPQNEHYREYEALGLLTVTEGNITDYSLIFEDICDLAKTFDLAEIAYDPHNATMLVTALTDEGLPVVEFGPTVLNFSEPMKQIEALILNRQFHHNGDKVMEWAMSNVVAKADRKDNVYPNKETNDKKIDPFVALCMAMGRHMAGGEKPDDWSGFLSSPVTG